MSDIWPIVHRERAALADDLDGLTDAQWSSPSLCAGWSVHQVLGHIVATTTMTPPRFIAKFVGARFDFTRFNERNVAAETRPTPTQTLAAFREHLTDRTAPPGPGDSWIGEIVVHAADIRRPLGLPDNVSLDAVRRAADFYKTSNTLIGTKSRIAGLTLRATDTDWCTGSGPEVTGPMVSLALAMTGRGAALGDLSGDGVATLTQRIRD